MNNESNKIYAFFTHPWVSFCFRLIVGSVFIYAGAIKIGNMDEMASSIANYRILPETWIHIPAIIMPALEITVGSCLILGLFMDGSLAIITVLMIFFLLAVESAILRGLDIECGCFSTSDAERVGMTVLLRDFLILLATVPIWMTKNHVIYLDRILGLDKPRNS